MVAAARTVAIGWLVVLGACDPAPVASPILAPEPTVAVPPAPGPAPPKVVSGAAEVGASGATDEEVPWHAALPPVGARYRTVRRVPWGSLPYVSSFEGARLRRGRIGQMENGMGYVMRLERVVYGDLDGDGVEEAAVQTYENGCGADGVDTYVWIYTVRAGRLVRLARVPTLDDEYPLRNVFGPWGIRKISRRELVFVRFDQGLTQRWSLRDGAMRLVGASRRR